MDPFADKVFRFDVIFAGEVLKARDEGDGIWVNLRPNGEAILVQTLPESGVRVRHLDTQLVTPTKKEA